MLKLSIIVPVYNAEQYLENCLNSIANQFISSWECILVDDGSTDNSGKICDEYAEKCDKFKVVHTFNNGPGNARNIGILLAKGEWLGFIDADDWIDPNRFSYVIEYAESNNLNYIECALKIWKNDKQINTWAHVPGLYTPEDNLQFSDLQHDMGHCINKLYKTKIVQDNNIKFETCKLAEDMFFNAHYYSVVNKLAVLSWSGYNYRRENIGSLSKKYITTNERLQMIHIFENFENKVQHNKSWALIESNFKEFFDSCLIRHSSPNTIDYVFPYVDNSDLSWQKLYIKTAHKENNPEVTGSFRFSGDEHNMLKYVFRGIEKFMPWIGIIHLIVQDCSQVPKWIDTSKVHIVTHKNFIPQKYLPTFNSSTIELFVPHIVGLSEKYINGNDDFFPIARLTPKMFFEDTDAYKGAPRYKYKLNVFKEGQEGSVWFDTFQNSLNLAMKITNSNCLCDNDHWVAPPHISIGYRKSICKEAWKYANKEILDSITTFREHNNISEYFYFWFTVLSNRYKDEMFHFSYEPVSTSDTKRISKIITQELTKYKSHPVRFICLNDTSSAKKDFFPIQVAFATLFPNKSEYEL